MFCVYEDDAGPSRFRRDDNRVSRDSFRDDGGGGARARLFLGERIKLRA